MLFRTKFRVGEYAYFKCSNPVAVIGASGMNVLELECGAGGNWPTNAWGTCVLEPTCNNLPVPSSGSGLRKALHLGDTVKLGEMVVYECERRAEFWEMPQPQVRLYIIFTTVMSRWYQMNFDIYVRKGAELKSLGGNPVSNNVGTVASIGSWPTCAQLPCVCLGQSQGLTVEESKNVLETSCKSEGNYQLMEVSNDRCHSC